MTSGRFTLAICFTAALTFCVLGRQWQFAGVVFAALLIVAGVRRGADRKTRP